MKYIAIAKLKGEAPQMIERECETKKEFVDLLHMSGYRISFVATEETFNEVAWKHEERNRKLREKRKYIQELKKEEADKYGISVAHLERAKERYQGSLLSWKECIRETKK